MSERKILITITEDLWDEDDQEELMSKVENVVHSMLFYDKYTVREFTE